MPSLATPISAGSIRSRFPELTSQDYPDSALDLAAESAMNIFSLNTEGALHLAAHFAVVWRMENTGEADGGAGVVSQEQIGPRMVTYRTMSEGDDTFFERTSYGRTYLIIRNRNPRRTMPFVVG